MHDAGLAAGQVGVALKHEVVVDHAQELGQVRVQGVAWCLVQQHAEASREVVVARLAATAAAVVVMSMVVALLVDECDHRHEEATRLVIVLVVVPCQLQDRRQVLPLVRLSHLAQRRQLKQLLETGELADLLTGVVRGDKLRLAVAVIVEKVVAPHDVVAAPDIVLEVGAFELANRRLDYRHLRLVSLLLHMPKALLP